MEGLRWYQVHLTLRLSCGPRGTLFRPAAKPFRDRGKAKSVNRRSRQLQPVAMRRSVDLYA